MSVVFETIFKSLKEAASRDLLVEVRGDALAPMSGAALSRAIGQARAALREAGVARGDRVGLLAPNRHLWAAADLAALAEGAVIVPLYDRQEPRELAEILADCGARVALCHSAELARGLAEGWSAADLEGDAPAALTFDEVFTGEGIDAPPQLPSGDELVTIIYTSGTSGRAKGVMTTAANVDFMVPQTVAALAKLYGDEPRPDERVFHYLPFCFAGSRIMLWTQLYRGQALMMSTDLNDLVREMGAARPSYFLNVPKLLERVRRGVKAKLRDAGGIGLWLYNLGEAAFLKRRAGERGFLIELQLLLASPVMRKIKGMVGPNWDFLICGSAPLAEETQAWFEMLGVPVYQVYGLTETTAIVTMDVPGQNIAGKVGVAIDGVTLRLADDGELLVRGANIFKGYWEMPEKTAEAIDAQGWFHTGDLAEVDAAGNWSILGRMNNVLVPESGHNVAPEPIEQAIKEACQDIEQAVVVGHGRRFLTCLVAAAQPLDPAAVQAALDAVNASLPHYRKVHRFAILPKPLSYEDELLTANEKLRRRAIDERYAELIASLYAEGAQG